MSVSEPIYAVGDLQGCLESFEELIDMLDPNASFVFVGDIVNRGPASLETLRRVKALDEAGRCRAVLLGNHDLGFSFAARQFWKVTVNIVITAMIAKAIKYTHQYIGVL